MKASWDNQICLQQVVLADLRGLWSYCPPCPSLLGRQFCVCWQGERSRWATQGETSRWTSSALDPSFSFQESVQCWEPGTMRQGCCCCRRHHNAAVPGAFASLSPGVRFSTVLCAQLRVTLPRVASAQRVRPPEGTGSWPHGTAGTVPALSREALWDQLIPTHCGRSFPGTKKPVLVCDQIP